MIKYRIQTCMHRHEKELEEKPVPPVNGLMVPLGKSVSGF